MSNSLWHFHETMHILAAGLLPASFLWLGFYLFVLPEDCKQGEAND